MSSFHYKVNFWNDITSWVIVRKFFMNFYYITNICEMLNFFLVWLWGYCNAKINIYKQV